MASDHDRLRDLLRRAFDDTGAETILWIAGAGLPSGTAVEIFGWGAPIDGTIQGGAPCGEMTTRLSRAACVLLAEIEDRMASLGLSHLQASVGPFRGPPLAAGSGPDGALLLLPHPSGASHGFPPEAAAVLESLPEGRTLLVSGLSAHDRVALGAAGTPVRDGSALANLLSPHRLPAGTRQGTALRQGPHVALVEAAHPFPLFHRIP